MIGDTVSHYKILDRLGVGGMGVVYKAEDLRLQRLVALKFLPLHALDRDDRKARFLREARAAASLQHPNICTVYEIDEADGQPFIAMAYLEGHELSHEITRGPLEINRLLDIAIQVTQALREAHGKGVIHRDVKPSNIMLTKRGQAVLMDFGLALLAAEAAKLTREGATLGTTFYMSPEQTSSGKVDQRTDIWSFGVVLYQMATGELPFQGDYEPAILYAVLNEKPEPAARLRSGMPANLDRIIGRCLEKDAGDRYPNTEDLLADLNALQQAGSAVSAARQPAAQEATPFIAVLPFVNRNRDEETEYFSDGLTDELISALTQVKGLRVVARASAFQFKGKTEDLEEIGRKLRVSSVLDGTVRTAGKRIRVTAQLVDVENGYQIWSQTFDRVMEDIFDLQDEIAQGIVKRLRGQLVTSSEKPLVKRPTENVEAYDLYLKGLYHYNQWTEQGLQKAISHFERARSLDPDYAEAYAALGFARGTYSALGWAVPHDVMPTAKTEALRAVEIDESIAEAHTTLGVILESYEWNWEAAEREFQRALALNPADVRNHVWYSDYLARVGRFDEAVSAAETALQLDPLSQTAQHFLEVALLQARRYQDCIAQIEKTLELYPGHTPPHWLLGQARAYQGDFEGGVAALEKGLSLDPGNALLAGFLGWASGRTGRHARAQELLDRSLERRRESYFPAVCIACIYLGLGETDSTFEWLERAYEEHDLLLSWLKVWAVADPLRSDPRFQDLLQRMNFG